MQPTFLPWAGFFNLMSQADIFISLDDVQLEKQSWQTRNKLIISGRPEWISLPIKHTHLGQKIIETSTSEEHIWLRKTINKFHHSYSKHPHYGEAIEIFKLLEECVSTNLSNINETILLYIAEKLKAKPIFYRSSDLKIEGKRSERLVNLCEYFNAKEYLSPIGSTEYLSEDAFTQKTTTKLRFQNFSPSKYKQHGSLEFISHLSIVDVVANLGWSDARKYINGTYK